MLRNAISLASIATALLLLAPAAFAANSKAIPCAVGQGETNPCDYCDESRALDVTAWQEAKMVDDFVMPNAPSQTGGGYDLYWKIEEPGEGCRILLFEPFNTDKGSINPKIPGNILLSVNHRGCYPAHVGSRGVAAGACCWDECKDIGAIPHSSPQKLKRELLPPLSRVVRSMLGTETELKTLDVEPRSNIEGQGGVQARNTHRTTKPKLTRRGRGGQNPDPSNSNDKQKPVWNCVAKAFGFDYSRSGIQQPSAISVPCGIASACDFSSTVSVSAATTISSDKTTTFTNSQGVSVSATAGVMMVGPTATLTVGYNADFSKAVAESMGEAKTDTYTSTITVSQSVAKGATYNGWWTPQLRCQMYKFSCNDGKEQADFEKCVPWKVGDKAVGAQGVMVTGS